MSKFRKASLDGFLETARRKNPAVFDRLMGAIKRDPLTLCWELQRYLSAGGYGAIRVGGIKQRAHRWMFEALFGPVGDLEIRHMCHNPSCIFPGHLREGTHLENMHDRRDAGRGGDLRGESNGRAKLTNNDILNIRASAESCTTLGLRLGVSKVMISRIRRGLAWGHV